ncbi:MAG: YafY family transcriptional regulator [Clostridiales bacterium]|nr:YafY family transcriptional regulator [Clostridiales bacterium]
MNADYLLTIYFTLMNKRKKVKRTTLAARAGVNVRTVSRAIDTLTLAGVPVYSETGPDGGYYIPDDYVITQASFSAEEKARIVSCIRAAQQNFSDNLCENVLDKLGSIAAPNENYLIKSDTLVIDASGWNEPQHTSARISVLGRAVNEKKTVRMKYVDRYEFSSERLFDPYCLVQKGGTWYVYGYCHRREDFRLFKIARIEDVVITDNVFEKKPSNVYEKLRGDFPADDLVPFTIEFTSLILPEIEEWLGADAIEDRGTCYAAHAELFGGAQLIGKLLSFGSSIKVTEPAYLREEIEIECKRMLQNYEN